MTMEPKPLEMRAIDVPMGGDSTQVSTIYVDDIRGFMNLGETVRFGLIEYRATNDGGEVVAVPVASLVMPASKVRDWGNFFIKLADAADTTNQQVPDGD